MKKPYILLLVILVVSCSSYGHRKLRLKENTSFIYFTVNYDGLGGICFHLFNDSGTFEEVCAGEGVSASSTVIEADKIYLLKRIRFYSGEFVIAKPMVLPPVRAGAVAFGGTINVTKQGSEFTLNTSRSDYEFQQSKHLLKEKYPDIENNFMFKNLYQEED